MVGYIGSGKQFEFRRDVVSSNSSHYFCKHDSNQHLSMLKRVSECIRMDFRWWADSGPRLYAGWDTDGVSFYRTERSLDKTKRVDCMICHDTDQRQTLQ